MTKDLVKTTVQLGPHRVPTAIRECWKEGSMWPLVTAVGICGSARVHDAGNCCTYPVAVPTLIFGADGLMLAHGALLAR